jgi:hypothetical protein
MIREIYSVRAILTDLSPDCISEILHGDGGSLGPTFDKLQQEALGCGGSFEDWEPTRCDFAFPTKEAAQIFVKRVRSKFQEQVYLEFDSRIEEQDGRGMRSYKELPESVENRIAELTPQVIGSLKVEIRILEDADCLIAPDSEKIQHSHKATFVNMQCKVTGKVRSKAVLLRSGPEIALPAMQKAFITIDDFRRELDRAKIAGWTKHDMTYDALINGIMVQEIDRGTVYGKPCPEINFACDKVMIILYDYYGDQFIGWFYYNENMDDLLNFTNYKL